MNGCGGGGSDNDGSDRVGAATADSLGKAAVPFGSSAGRTRRRGASGIPSKSPIGGCGCPCTGVGSNAMTRPKSEVSAPFSGSKAWRHTGQRSLLHQLPAKTSSLPKRGTRHWTWAALPHVPHSAFALPSRGRRASRQIGQQAPAAASSAPPGPGPCSRLLVAVAGAARATTGAPKQPPTGHASVQMQGRDALLG